MAHPQATARHNKTSNTDKSVSGKLMLLLKLSFWSQTAVHKATVLNTHILHFLLAKNLLNHMKELNILMSELCKQRHDQWGKSAVVCVTTIELHPQRHIQQGREWPKHLWTLFVNSTVNYSLCVKKYWLQKLKTMLVFSQPEGTLCVTPVLLLTKLFLPSLLVKFLNHWKYLWVPFCAANPPKESRPLLPNPRKEMVLTRSSVRSRDGKKKIHLLLLPLFKFSWIIFLFASFSL